MSANVLIVDDDPQMVKVVARTLGSRGYEVRTASDAESAMGAMRARCPGLVITDLEMPAMDGIEFCRQVRDISNVPIIVMSDTGDCRSEVAALDSGADDYLVKPFDNEQTARSREGHSTALFRHVRTHGAWRWSIPHRL